MKDDMGECEVIDACPILSQKNRATQGPGGPGCPHRCYGFPLVSWAAARISKLVSTALRTTPMYSKMALRSHGTFFFFAFLRDNFPDIVLEPKRGTLSPTQPM